MTDAHIVKRQLDEAIAYPAHDPRTESAEYKAVHHHLVYELNEPCWICGITHDAGGNMETHHAVVEWALANAVDPKKIMADWPAMGEATDPALRKWLDSEGNMLVLCETHHRGGLYGIHMVSYPAWLAQRYLFDGYDLATGEHRAMHDEHLSL